KNAPVDEHTRPQQALAGLPLRQACRDGMARGIAYQPRIVAHLAHDLVTGVDTGAAPYAHILQAIAYIDAGRAYLHAKAAIHAVAHSGLFVVDLARASAA